MKIEPEIAEIAGLCHDIGHPPFGHTGEYALDECMKSHGGFEGNAQTLRILARLEKRERGDCETLTGIDRNRVDCRRGLNLCFRTLAAVLKYDNKIPLQRKSAAKVEKGYYGIDADIVSQVKAGVLGDEGSKDGSGFKTVECQIMDLADDIAYSVYDLEDALKAGFVTPLSIMASDPELLNKVASDTGNSLGRTISADDVVAVLVAIFGQVFDQSIENPKAVALRVYQSADLFAANAYLRTKLTSELISQFIQGIEFEPNEISPCRSRVSFNKDVALQVEVLKRYTYGRLIMSPRLRIVAHRGKEIVKKVFTSLANHDDDSHELLPNDFRELYDAVEETERFRVVCDFVSGMTDRYALEFYGRLTSERPETIFKPM